MDTVPYEYTVEDLPDAWGIVDDEFPNMTEEQANSPGISDWLEVRRMGRRL